MHAALFPRWLAVESQAGDIGRGQQDSNLRPEVPKTQVRASR